MNKVYSILLLAFAALFAAPASAQLKFGLKGGVDVTHMSLSRDVLDNDNRAGFYIGPTVRFSMLGLGFDASALYDQRSAKISVDGEGNEPESEHTVTQKQIAVPINLRYGVGLGSKASVFFFAGPQFGFNVGGDKKFSDMDWKWKDTNFSVNVGLGVTVLDHLQVNANYNIACGKTSEMENAVDVTKGIVGNVRSRYNAWQIGVAYYF